MTEEEIMIRVREAFLATTARSWTTRDNIDGIRRGAWDDLPALAPVVHALRDLSKPLDEIRPVDPDLLLAREMAAAQCEAIPHHWAEPIRRGEKDADARSGVSLALAALKRGREMERGQ